jgi:4-hydroxybenzoate polyprenyltransferase
LPFTTAGKIDLDRRSLIAIIASSLIIFTTIHASDFCDAPGDAQMGRKTLPVVYPEASRISIPVLLVGWSLILCSLWHTATWTYAALTVVSALVGMRFWWKRDVESDKRSYQYYNLWLTCAHVLPLLSVS